MIILKYEKFRFSSIFYTYALDSLNLGHSPLLPPKLKIMFFTPHNSKDIIFLSLFVNVIRDIAYVAKNISSFELVIDDKF